jgi:hypothetical protein
MSVGNDLLNADMPTFTDKSGRTWDVTPIPRRVALKLGKRTERDRGEALVNHLWDQCGGQAALRGVSMMDFVQALHDGEVIERAAQALTGA